MNHKFEMCSFKKKNISIEDCIITDIFCNQDSVTLIFADGIMVHKDTKKWEHSGIASLTLCNCAPDDIMCWEFRGHATFHHAWGIGTMPDFEKVVRRARKRKCDLIVDTFIYINERLLMRFKMKPKGKLIGRTLYEVDCYLPAIQCKYEM